MNEPATPDRRPGGPCPSKALRNLHVLLVLTSVAFAAILGLYWLLVRIPRLPPEASRAPTIGLAVGSFLVAAAMLLYLRAFLRRTSA